METNNIYELRRQWHWHDTLGRRCETCKHMMVGKKGGKSFRVCTLMTDNPLNELAHTYVDHVCDKWEGIQ